MSERQTTLPEKRNPSTEELAERESTVRRRRRKLPTRLPALDLWEVNMLVSYLKGAAPEDISREMGLPLGTVKAMADKLAVYRTLTDPEMARGKQAWLVNSLTGAQRKALKLLLDIGTGVTGKEPDPNLIFSVSKQIRETMKALQPKGPGTQVQVGVAFGGQGSGGGGGTNFEQLLRGVIQERQREEGGTGEGETIDAEAIENNDDGN